MIRSTKDTNLRDAARRKGFILQKRRNSFCPGLGTGYMIMDAFCGKTVAGERYELQPEDVRDFLNERKNENENAQKIH